MAIEQQQQLEKTEYLSNIENVRKFFADPESAGIEALSSLGKETIEAMAQIYASRGDPSKLAPETLVWLESSATVIDPKGNLNAVTGQILYRELSTRRFDHKFIGQIHPQGSIPGILGNLIAAYMNTNTVVKEVSSAENQMESEVLNWLADLFGYDKKEFSGNIVTGGTSANIAALWVARDKKIKTLKEEGKWNKNTDLIVLGSSTNHYSIDKACYILGENVVYEKVDPRNLKTDVDAIRERAVEIQKKGGVIMTILALAGETETGMVDDLESLANIAQEFNAYYHVDAAYGGPFILTREGYRFKGIQRADSITVDPHKMLYTPYPAGAILFRSKHDHTIIERGMRENAGYLSPEETRANIEKRDEERNFGFSRVEGSMGSYGAISTWATIKLLGKEGISTLLNHTLKLTNYAHQRATTSNILEPLHVPETNTLLLGLSPNLQLSLAKNNEVVKIAKERLDSVHGFYISCDDQILKGKRIFRFVAMHPYTTNEIVEELIDTLEYEIAQQIESE